MGEERTPKWHAHHPELLGKPTLKPLATIGGRTPEGESGLRVKVLGKAKSRKAKLELTFSPAGGTEASRTVTVRLG